MTDSLLLLLSPVFIVTSGVILALVGLFAYRLCAVGDRDQPPRKARWGKKRRSKTGLESV